MELNKNIMDIRRSYLPQISAPFVYVLNALDNHDIEYQSENIPLADLNPMQPFVDTEKVASIFDAVKNGKQQHKTIWITQDNDIIDGHHNYSAAWKDDPESSISAIKILGNKNDAIRILNKIMDIYNHEFANPENKNEAKFIGYRTEPIKEQSGVGNFFLLKEPSENCLKYELEFDNIFDTDSIGIKFDDKNLPTYTLCNYMFPDLKPEQHADLNDMEIDKFCNRYLAKKFKEMGFDGIKYGNLLLQAF